jgi:hypothetical protein
VYVTAYMSNNDVPRRCSAFRLPRLKTSEEALPHQRRCCWRSLRRGTRRESLLAQECMSSPAETVSGFVIVELQVIRSAAKEKCAAAK